MRVMINISFMSKTQLGEFINMHARIKHQENAFSRKPNFYESHKRILISAFWKAMRLAKLKRKQWKHIKKFKQLDFVFIVIYLLRMYNCS